MPQYHIRKDACSVSKTVQHLVSTSVILLSLNSCSTCNSTRVINPIGPLNGYEYAFPFPRTDIPPGTVVIRWDSGQIDVICRPEEYHVGSLNDFVNDSPGITIDENQKQKIKATISANVKGVVEAEIGGNSAKTIVASMQFTPKSTKDSAAAIIAAGKSALCKERADGLRQIHGDKLKNISLVSDVAEFNFEFDITMERTIGADAKLGEKLSAKLEASAEVGTENSNKVKISAKKTYTHYNLTQTALVLRKGS